MLGHHLCSKEHYNFKIVSFFKKWHPVRPIVASISQGVVTVWAQQQVENWSAFAPDFKELDENVDYEERESEFDLEDEDKSVQLDEEVKAEVVDEVDVDTNVPIPAFCSSDEDEEDKSALLYLPIAPEIEDPEENWVPGVDPSPTKDESPHKRSSSNNDAAKENTSPKKKRPKTTDIVLENAPTDGKILLFRSTFQIIIVYMSFACRSSPDDVQILLKR